MRDLITRRGVLAIGILLFAAAGCSSDDTAGSADTASGGPDAGSIADSGSAPSDTGAGDTANDPDAGGVSDTGGAPDTGTADTAPTPDADAAVQGDAPQTDVTPDAQTGPCLEAHPSIVEFYVINPGTVEQKTVTLSNCGDAPVTLTGVTAGEGGKGEITLLDAETLAGKALAAGDTLSLTIQYAESDDGIDDASFVINADDPALDVTIEVHILTWPDTCVEQIVSDPSTVFGAVAVADSQTVYVTGDANVGSQWLLGEVDITGKTLTPVISMESVWTYEEWIRVQGDDVSILEFYPSSQTHTYNRVTKQVTSAPADELGTNAPYEYGGAQYSLHIGQGGEDDCANVCILRDDLANAGPVELVDDGDEDFSIHTGAVYFIDGWVYFMTYQSVFNTPGNNALRRIALPGGAVETAYTFDGPQVNAWINEPVRASDGTLYWLRTQQETLEAPWLAFVDRHHPATGLTDAALVSGLAKDPRALSLHADDLLLWVDADGLRSAPATQGGEIQTLAALPAGQELSRMYYAVADGRAYFSRTTGSNEAHTATIGCVVLAP